MKKFVSILLTLCFCANISFAFDPYADEEIEKKSYKKLYYGIALTLLGGFLAYDGFSLEKVDVSKPSVDFLSVSHSEWVQVPETFTYQLRSGIALNNLKGVTYYNSGGTRIVDYGEYEVNKNFNNTKESGASSSYNPEDYDRYTVEPNILYNNGNVALRNLTIEVRYKFADGYVGIDNNGVVRHIDEKGRYYDENGTLLGVVKDQGYHVAEIKKGTIDYYDKDGKVVEITDNDERVKRYTYEDSKSKLNSLEKGDFVTWQDILEYSTDRTDSPVGSVRAPHFYDPENEDPDKKYDPGIAGLHLGKDSAVLMEVRVKLEKNKQYTPIYETRHKSDAEGVAGILVGITGIYFIIDHFLDMHKFNAYAKRHHLNLKFATASNEYKLLLQKRI